MFHDFFQNSTNNNGVMQENNSTELERLGREKKDDFLDMLKGFVVNQVCAISKFLSILCYIFSKKMTSSLFPKQVGYAERIALVWEQAAQETSVYAKQ